MLSVSRVKSMLLNVVKSFIQNMKLQQLNFQKWIKKKSNQRGLNCKLMGEKLMYSPISSDL
ncbi:CLUMA_CG008551, isoform A [Clunio marinus]|uniref:CLUMA_CG008551, isoform A n=1 Tax=Clunio marinus TaxID=568069 RepID=A0A1J1I9G4_9DIPT|nr:CLUMA_CG008551, isoform A [Clunio marinus]